MAKILVDLLQYTGTKGGIEAYIKELYSSPEFLNSGFEFIGFACKEFSENINHEWFPGTIFNSGISGENRFSWAAGELFRVSKYAEQIKADLIHCPAMLGPVKSKIPTIITFHDLSYFTHPELMKNKLFTYPVRWMERRSAKNACRIISISHTTAELIPMYLGFPSSKIDVIHSAGRKLQIVGKSPRDRRSDLFLVMGQRSPYKSLETAVYAWSEIPKHIRPTLVITGSHGEDPLRELVEQLELQDSVELMGWLPEGKLNHLLNSATALIETTIAAGFGMPALEAMQIGLPVITTNIEVFHEIAGAAAAYFEPKDPKSLATKVLEIKSQIDLQITMSNLGIERSKQFSWELCCSQTLEAFSKALR